MKVLLAHSQNEIKLKFFVCLFFDNTNKVKPLPLYYVTLFGCTTVKVCRSLNQ